MKVIFVASGKGGVGKTTVSVLLSLMLASKGFKTGLIDADITCPSIAKFLGMRDEKLQIDSECSKIIPYSYSDNLEILSIGQDVPDNQSIAWRGSRITDMIMEMVSGVDWGDISYLVFDLPPGTSDEVLTLIEMFKDTSVKVGGLIVTMPTILSLTDVNRVISLFNFAQINIIGVVENMSSKVFGKDMVEEFCIDTGQKFLLSIPLKIDIRKISEDNETIPNIIKKYNIEDILQAVEDF